jgi:hypothetical protein
MSFLVGQMLSVVQKGRQIDGLLQLQGPRVDAPGGDMRSWQR